MGDYSQAAEYYDVLYSAEKDYEPGGIVIIAAFHAAELSVEWRDAALRRRGVYVVLPFPSASSRVTWRHERPADRRPSIQHSDPGPAIPPVADEQGRVRYGLLLRDPVPDITVVWETHRTDVWPRSWT